MTITDEIDRLTYQLNNDRTLTTLDKVQINIKIMSLLKEVKTTVKRVAHIMLEIQRLERRLKNKYELTHDQIQIVTVEIERLNGVIDNYESFVEINRIDIMDEVKHQLNIGE